MFQSVYSKGIESQSASQHRPAVLGSNHVTAMAEKITHFFKRKKDVECGESSAKEGEKDEPSSNRKKLKPYHTAMLKTVQKWETNCELDTAICEFKLKPLAKVYELVKKLVSSPV